jgi:hypothetical protein
MSRPLGRSDTIKGIVTFMTYTFYYLFNLQSVLSYTATNVKQNKIENTHNRCIVVGKVREDILHQIWGYATSNS